ncbi:PRCC_Cterm domain-containing protein [Cephalotus follicularis]|uniref:PRCC_Cterm domain-containing protein n=1 Tax=Cephalotus follicularis TaxID=3775 RepID=A0A1Q3AVC4_CEPFO|nr:PRCC_Cterm domain-containing protein [Cephalotus follicularis]
MDSLLASYASSGEEEEEAAAAAAAPPSKSSSSKVYPLFSALPPPKSSPLSSSLENPTNPHNVTANQHPHHIKPTNPTSVFSSLPQPKTQQQQQPVSTTKRVVIFKPPIPIKPTNFYDDDDDDDDIEEKQRKKPTESESLTVKSFLSTIPAPNNSSTLGVLPSSTAGRRSVIQNEAPVSGFEAEKESGNDQIVGDYINYDTSYSNYDASGAEQCTGSYVDYGSYVNYDQNVSNGDASSHGGYDNYASYGNYNVSNGDASNMGGYDNNGSYGNNWGDSSTSMAPQAMPAVSDDLVRVPGKRRRNEVPLEIVEVKQDELMKDRPREDQSKLTGIAFGPSYQPVSTKGKPSKLHKRKHQIGTLYYDMKQKEMELSERRAKGFLTKAETQAKYGW